MKPRAPPGGPATRRIDDVVPMPRFSCSCWARLKMTPQACCTACSRICRMSTEATCGSPASNFSMRSRFSERTSRTSCTASDEATSPAAWPPMPSATMNRRSFLSMRKLSSLWSRCRPTSVAAQYLSSILPRKYHGRRGMVKVRSSPKSKVEGRRSGSFRHWTFDLRGAGRRPSLGIEHLDGRLVERRAVAELTVRIRAPAGVAAVAVERAGGAGHEAHADVLARAVDLHRRDDDVADVPVADEVAHVRAPARQIAVGGDAGGRVVAGGDGEPAPVRRDEGRRVGVGVRARAAVPELPLEVVAPAVEEARRRAQRAGVVLPGRDEGPVADAADRRGNGDVDVVGRDVAVADLAEGVVAEAEERPALNRAGVAVAGRDRGVAGATR